MPGLCVQLDVAVAIFHFKIDSDTFAKKNGPRGMQPRRPKTGVSMLMKLKCSLLSSSSKCWTREPHTHCSLPANKKSRVVCMTMTKRLLRCLDGHPDLGTTYVQARTARPVWLQLMKHMSSLPGGVSTHSPGVAIINFRPPERSLPTAVIVSPESTGSEMPVNATPIL